MLDKFVFAAFLLGLFIAGLVRAMGDGTWLSFLQTSGYSSGVLAFRVIFTLMLPYIFATIVAAVANLTSADKLRSLTKRFLTYSVLTTVLAICIGQILFRLFATPQGMAPFHSTSPFSIPNSIRTYERFFGLACLLAIGFGLLLNALSTSRLSLCLYVLQRLQHVLGRALGWILWMMPPAVFLITASAFSRIEVHHLMGLTGCLAAIVSGLLIHLVVVYPSILFFGTNLSPVEFYKRALPAIVATGTTGSVNASLPVVMNNLRTEFRIPEKVVAVLAPLGANFNLNGTALTEVVLVSYLLHAYGIQCTFQEYVTLIGFCLITSFGLTSLPCSMIAILTALASFLGIPLEGVGIIAGVDMVLVLLRASVNTVGDIVGIVFVCHRQPTTR